MSAHWLGCRSVTKVASVGRQLEVAFNGTLKIRFEQVSAECRKILVDRHMQFDRILKQNINVNRSLKPGTGQIISWMDSKSIIPEIFHIGVEFPVWTWTNGHTKLAVLLRELCFRSFRLSARRALLKLQFLNNMFRLLQVRQASILSGHSQNHIRRLTTCHCFQDVKWKHKVKQDMRRKETRAKTDIDRI